jgi:hypothetical protein
MQTMSQGPAFVVIESGDGMRVAPCAGWMTPARYNAAKRQMAEECGEFALQVAEYLKLTHAPYMVCLAVLDQDEAHQARGDQLTPIFMTGDSVQPGLLTSLSTRRPGLVINIDLTTTVLHFFGVRPDISVLGCAMHSVPAARNPLTQLQSMNEQMVATFNARPPVVEGYVLVLSISIVFYLISMIYIATLKRNLTGLFRPMNFRVMLIALMLAPFSLLLAPACHIYATLPLSVFLTLFSLLLATALAHWVKDLRLLFALVGLSTTLAICGDQLFRLSISGVRFYGIGNEYSGVLIGATLLGLYALIDYYAAWRRRLLAPTILLCGVVFVVLGAPGLGAKFGGMVVAIVCFSYALARAYGGSHWKRLVPTIGVGLVALFILMLLLNAHAHTHIGRAISDALQDPHSLLQTALRKWAMNLRIGVVMYRPIGMVRYVLRDHPIMNAGFLGILLGMIIGFFTNDAGVVMAATGLIFLAFPLMLLVLREMTVAPEKILEHAPTWRNDNSQ